jgi:Chalcone isomerase-like
MIVLLSLLLLFCLASARVERATGQTFADSVPFAQELLGVGVRTKGPFKVYAVGLYSNRAKVAAKAKGKSEADVKRHLPEIIYDGTLTLKMARDVASETMTSALSEAVRPRMGGKDRGQLDAFGVLIKKGAGPAGCKKGTTLTFACSSGSVSCIINGKNQGQIASSALSKALLATFTDSNAVSGSMKADVSSTICSWSK